MDQLFLGTLLFTVSAFLFPTVLTYHSLFAGVSGAMTWLKVDSRGDECFAVHLEHACHTVT